MTRKPEAEEVAAFREAVRDVRPIAKVARVVQRRPPKARATFRRRDELAVLAESLVVNSADLDVETGDELALRRPGLQDTAFRKLRRGQYRVEDELDLHGMTLPEAKHGLRAFLATALSRGLRCVRIVHGKGLGSGPRGPVLKNAVNVVLRRTDPVVAFCSARQVDGGTGAVYVLLAAPR